jgi:hypothetical protein
MTLAYIGSTCGNNGNMRVPLSNKEMPTKYYIINFRHTKISG